MDPKILAAIIGLIGLLVGALMQHLLHGRSEKGKLSNELKTQAYVDFINAVSTLAASAKAGEDRDREAFVKLTDAKSRIAIYGDHAVIDNLARFTEQYGVLNSKKALASFMQIVKAMRADSIGNISSETAESMSVLLFEKRIKA